MQLFGIVSILITISLVLLWIASTNNSGSVHTANESVSQDRARHVEILESAEQAAEQLSR